MLNKKESWHARSVQKVGKFTKKKKKVLIRMKAYKYNGRKANEC